MSSSKAPSTIAFSVFLSMVPVHTGAANEDVEHSSTATLFSLIAQHSTTAKVPTTLMKASLPPLLNRLRVTALSGIIIRTIVDDPFASERVFDDHRPGCIHEHWWDWLTCSDLAAGPDVHEFYCRAGENLKSLRKTGEYHQHSLLFETMTVLVDEYIRLQHLWAISPSGKQCPKLPIRRMRLWFVKPSTSTRGSRWGSKTSRGR